MMVVRPDVRLVLISAPAGFGKTSCLLAWCHDLKRSGRLVIWYALDKQDNDPVRFASHLSKAFQNAAGLAAGDELVPGAATSLDDMLSRIINELADNNQRYVLALDDYHLITAPEIHAALSLMLEHLPPNIQLAIASRADPPLQLSRLRARGQIVELRASDLRFDSSEIASFFKQALGVMPSAAQIERLDQTSEGWAAALRLMTLALYDTRQNVDDAAISRLLGRYSTAQQYIFDYFADEVFAQQSEATRNFLLDTCVLNQLTPDLCGTLTGNCDAPLILNRLAQANLFLIPLSEAQPVYRYHHLVEDFLRHRLQLENPARFSELHRAAAGWYELHSDWVEAIQHALTAVDYTYAAWLIEAHGWEALTSRGEIMTILSWLPHFPDSILRQYPRLCLYFSRCLYLTGELERSEMYVRLAIETLDENESNTQEHQALRAIAANYQATLAAYRGDIDAAQTWIEQAKALRDTVGDLDRVRIVNSEGFVHYLRGDIPAARRVYTHALELAQQIQHHYLTLDAHYYLAQIDLLAADLRAVCERCNALLAQYTNPIGPLSMIMLPLAQALFQQNQPIEAEAVLRNAVVLARRSNIPDVVWYGSMLLADMLMSRGKITEAKACISEARTRVRGYQSAMMGSFIGAAEARLMLRSDQLQTALDWAIQYQQSAKASYHQDYENLTLAHVWLAQREYERGQALLAQLIADAQFAGRVSTIIAAEILRALMHQALSETDAALNALQRALVFAYPQGYVFLFLNAGQPMLKLLRLALEQGIAPEYVTSLLELAGHPDHTRHPADTLTERELEVLKYMAQGASNQDITDALVVSLGTVKSHIHHIMDKLGAQNRTEAVAKARSLNILSD